MEVKGRTQSGEVVEVRHHPDGLGHGVFGVWIDTEEVEVVRVDRLRDGGTTILHLAGERQIKFPRRVGDLDRTPRLDKEMIE